MHALPTMVNLHLWDPEFNTSFLSSVDSSWHFVTARGPLTSTHYAEAELIQAHWPLKSDLNNFPNVLFKKKIKYQGFVQRLLTTWAWVPRIVFIRPSWEIRVGSTHCRQSPFYLHWDRLDQLEAMARGGRLTCMIWVTSQYSQPQR